MNDTQKKEIVRLGIALGLAAARLISGANMPSVSLAAIAFSDADALLIQAENRGLKVEEIK